MRRGTAGTPVARSSGPQARLVRRPRSVPGHRVAVYRARPGGTVRLRWRVRSLGADQRRAPGPRRLSARRSRARRPHGVVASARGGSRTTPVGLRTSAFPVESGSCRRPAMAGIRDDRPCRCVEPTTGVRPTGVRSADARTAGARSGSGWPPECPAWGCSARRWESRDAGPGRGLDRAAPSSVGPGCADRTVQDRAVRGFGPAVAGRGGAPQPTRRDGPRRSDRSGPASGACVSRGTPRCPRTARCSPTPRSPLVPTAPSTPRCPPRGTTATAPARPASGTTCSRSSWRWSRSRSWCVSPPSSRPVSMRRDGRSSNGARSRSVGGRSSSRTARPTPERAARRSPGCTPRCDRVRSSWTGCTHSTIPSRRCSTRRGTTPPTSPPPTATARCGSGRRSSRCSATRRAAPTDSPAHDRSRCTGTRRRTPSCGPRTVRTTPTSSTSASGRSSGTLTSAGPEVAAAYERVADRSADAELLARL